MKRTGYVVGEAIGIDERRVNRREDSRSTLKVGKERRLLRRKKMRRDRAYGLKLVAIILLSSGDLILNTFADQCADCDSVLTALGQMICQIGVFMTFFLFMFETYPFKVGIVRPLFKRFRFHIVVMIAYIGVSTYHVTNRNTLINDLDEDAEDHLHSDLWDYDSFYGSFIIQKLLAVPFYVAAVNIGTTLTQPKYFDEAYWVAYSKSRRGF